MITADSSARAVIPVSQSTERLDLSGTAPDIAAIANSIDTGSALSTR
jgi:hypothetical protein